MLVSRCGVIVNINRNDTVQYRDRTPVYCSRSGISDTTWLEYRHVRVHSIYESGFGYIVWMRWSCDLVNVYTKLVKVYQTFTRIWADNNKTLMILTWFSYNIITSNGRTRLWRQLYRESLVKFIRRRLLLNFALSRQNVTLHYIEII